MRRHTLRYLSVSMPLLFAAMTQAIHAQGLQPIKVEGQPLGANINRLIQALDYLGSPLPADTTTELRSAVRERDAATLQRLIDPSVLLVVHLNPEFRVQVLRGPAQAKLQQGGFTPVLVKVVNNSLIASQLDILSSSFAHW